MMWIFQEIYVTFLQLQMLLILGAFQSLIVWEPSNSLISVTLFLCSAGPYICKSFYCTKAVLRALNIETNNFRSHMCRELLPLRWPRWQPRVAWHRCSRGAIREDKDGVPRCESAWYREKMGCKGKGDYLGRRRLSLPPTRRSCRPPSHMVLLTKLSKSHEEYMCWPLLTLHKPSILSQSHARLICMPYNYI